MLNMNLYLQFVFTMGDMDMWRILVVLKFLKALVKRRMPRRKCHRRFRTRSRLALRRNTEI
ncbi:hypothetical protein Golob_019367, partial [Gossypium lobatum]|nr:hypothetical protein [Gossypium lobatum]